VRELTYLFGGQHVAQHATAFHADTWASDGKFWTQVARFGPSARARHTTTFDTARGNSVVFGGDSTLSETLGDTWVFDGNEWTQVEDIGPLSRCDHAAAYDSARQRVVVFGGVHRDE
jgi:N-acetylneuraminic acid mutarotase